MQKDLSLKEYDGKILVVAGPTASGKSQLALDVATAYNGTVINADASQVYKDIPLLSACPTEADKRQAEHLLYQYLDGAVNGTVVDWLKEAEKAIRQTWVKGKLPIVTGGTGLYIENLINGTTPIPAVEPDIRARATELLENFGIEGLFAKLKEIDAKAAAALSPNDKTRVRRAYEIMKQTGISVMEWYKRPLVKVLPEASFTVVKIMPEKAELDERCNIRFDKMMAAGAEEEVRCLQAKKIPAEYPVMKALGVPEICSALSGNITMDEAVVLSKLRSRQYAKRQRTWFGNRLTADAVLDECYDGRLPKFVGGLFA